MNGVCVKHVTHDVLDRRSADEAHVRLKLVMQDAEREVGALGAVRGERVEEGAADTHRDGLEHVITTVDEELEALVGKGQAARRAKNSQTTSVNISMPEREKSS